MKTGCALAAATLMAFTASAPALAEDNDWKRGTQGWNDDHRDDRRWDDRRWDDRRWDDRRWDDRRWNDRPDRRDEARAYRNGYRDGVRADNRRERFRGQDWRTANNGYRYDDRGNWHGNQGYRYPTYRGASINGQDPYWWGSNGQVHCRRQDGTAGLIVGALAGGTLGNVIAGEGDKRLGSVIGGTLGAVLGNEIARGDARCR